MLKGCAPPPENFSTLLIEHTCRAFREIFRFFLVIRAEVGHLMHIYAFSKGKTRACNARQQRSPKLEGDLVAQPLSDFDPSQTMREYMYSALIRLAV